MRKPFSWRRIAYVGGISGACIAMVSAPIVETLIISGPPTYCTADTIVALKGGVYKTCRYLAALHKTSDWGFVAGVAIMMIGVILGADFDKGHEPSAPPTDSA